MVHFGTTYADTREKTIEVINAKMKEAFPELEIREAWTSRIILRKLKERGEERLNPTEALIRLQKEGFTHVLVQSTNIIEGTEMTELFFAIRLTIPPALTCQFLKSKPWVMLASTSSCPWP